MAKSGTNWIDFWISLSAVAQTAIWAGLVGVIVIRYRKSITEVVSTISQRVEQGDTVDIFGLKIDSVRESAEREAKIENEIRNVVRESLSSDDTMDDSEILSERIISTIRDRSLLTIDFSGVGLQKRASIPYGEFEGVGLLLKYVWLEAKLFSVSSYNIEWLVKNERTGEYLTEAGSKFANKHLGTRWDERPLNVAGIDAGDTISVHWVKAAKST